MAVQETRSGWSPAAAVLVHGMLGRAEVLAPLARPLADAGVCTKLLELPGAGEHWSGIRGDARRHWVDQVAAGPLDIRPTVLPRDTAGRDGYAAGRVFELRLPSVRRRIPGEIVPTTQGLTSFCTSSGKSVSTADSLPYVSRWSAVPGWLRAA